MFMNEQEQLTFDRLLLLSLLISAIMEMMVMMMMIIETTMCVFGGCTPILHHNISIITE